MHPSAPHHPPADPPGDCLPPLARRLAPEAGTYRFQAVKDAKARARERFPRREILDFGVGEPDIPAHPAVVERLCAGAGLPENRFYADNGIPEFRQAASRWLAETWGVEGMDPDTQILPGMGSKPLLALAPALVIDPGDHALVAVPGYPIMGTWTRYLGGNVTPLPLAAENDWLPDYGAIPPEILEKARILYLNYPHNPTGARCTADFFARTVDFAARHRILVVHDASYGALVPPEEKPLSFLSVPGADRVGMEIFSLSKAFHMTGWRLAFAAGNPRMIAALGRLKDNTDSGQFRALQKAGVTALSRPDITRDFAARCHRRRHLLEPVLARHGFAPAAGGTGFYLWCRAPRSTKTGTVFANAAEAAGYLMEEAGISVVPWDDTGAALRFSVTFEAPDQNAETAVVAELDRRLKELRPEF